MSPRPLRAIGITASAFALSASGVMATASEPNNSWADAIDVAAPWRVTDEIDFSTPGPDTTLGLFDEAGALGLVDNDASFFGNGFASAFYREPVNPDGSIRFAVSGFGDFDLDGLDDESGQGHGETGGFDAMLTVYGTDGRVIESRDLSGQLAPGVAVDFPTQSDPSWIGGSFDLELNNWFGPASDLDYWAFRDVPLGASFVVEVLGADFDTLLGLYDSSGQLIDADDDGGEGILSRLEGEANDGSTVYVAVTSYPDYGFQGVHSATGGYTLRLLVIPEPTSAVAAALAFVGLSRVSGRRRVGGC